MVRKLFILHPHPETLNIIYFVRDSASVCVTPDNETHNEVKHSINNH